MFVAVPDHSCYDSVDDVIEPVSDTFLKKLSASVEIMGVTARKVKAVKPKDWVKELITRCKILGTCRSVDYVDFLTLREGVQLIVSHMGNDTRTTCRVNISMATLADEGIVRFPYGIDFLHNGLETNAIPHIKRVVKAIVPYGVKEIHYTFNACPNLIDVELPETVGVIGDRAFYHCTSLQHIQLNKVHTLKDEAFEGCTQLKSVQYQSLRLAIGYGVFSGCEKLEEIDLTRVTAIGAFAFKCTKLKTVELNPNVVLERSAFSYISTLREVKILSDYANVSEPLIKKPRNGHEITTAPFVTLRNLETIDLSGWHKTVLYDMFGDCQIVKTAILPTSVRAIGKRCFFDCHSLRLVVLPDDLQYISDKCVGDIPVKFQYKGNTYTPEEFYIQFPMLVWHN